MSSYFAQLTKGALGHMLADRKIEDPILQVLAYKSMPTENAKRYRLIVSDGAYSYQCCIVMGDNAEKIESGEFDRFCLLKISKYLVNENKGTQVIVLTEPKLLFQGSQVGERLGDPVAYGSSGAPPLSKFKPNYHVTSSTDDMECEFENDPFNDVGNASSSTSNYQSGAKRMKSNSGKPSRSTSSNEAQQLNPELVCPISAINPYTNKWIIKGRCTSKTNRIPWANLKGIRFSFEIKDASGDIRITGFNAECEKYFDLIKVGEVYLVSKGLIKNSNKQYSNTTSDYEVNLNPESIIEQCVDESNCPAITYDFKPLDQLNESMGGFVDIIAVIKILGDIETVVKKNTNKELVKRDLHLVDQSATEVILTLWGETATNFTGEVEDVIIGRGIRVTEFNGLSLSMTMNSHIEVNNNDDQVMVLKGWYSRVKNSLETKSLTTKTGGSFVAPWGNLNEINLENVNENGYTLQTKAIIHQLGKSTFYKGCKTCNKKLIDVGNGFYRCEKCSNDTTEFNYRLIMSFSISDHTGNCWVQCFHEEAMKILGDVNLEELFQLYENQMTEFDDKIKQFNFKAFIFKVRGRMEHFNDSNRIRSQVMNLQPVNYIEYGNILINKMREN